jgi:hypothetical protein
MARKWKKAMQKIDTSCAETCAERRRISANRCEADL